LSEREFWQTIYRSLMAIAAAIQKKHLQETTTKIDGR
jgi:hypothetical protein